MLKMNLSLFLKLALIMILSILTCAWPCLSSNWTISCNEEERKGLMKFKQSLQDPYNLLSSWKGNNCCRSWTGVTCHRVTGRVIKLKLQETWSSKYSGKAPYRFSSYYEDWKFKPFVTTDLNPGLASLEYLTHLDLSGIWFANIVVVPRFFASMKQLRHLRLVANGEHSCRDCLEYHPLDSLSATGFRPSHYETEYRDEEDLDALCCSWDSSGNLVIDNVQWLSRLQALRSLEISGVPIKRPFEFTRTLNQLPSLSVLGLSDCYLESSHLSHFNSTFLARVQYLDLSSSALSSPIPFAFGNMTSLRYLDLSYNFFNSTILMCLGNLKSIIHISLHYNEIDNIGGVLLSLLENNPHAKSLILSHNRIRSTGLPFHYNSSKSIGHDMEVLDLSDCGIQSPLPSWLGDLEKLRYLLLSGNYFVGSIPKMTNLKKLDLSNNGLDEMNLTSLGRLSHLESLDLTGNMLKGNILELLPDFLETSVNLKKVDLSYNRLEGTIPPTISKLVALELLYLNHNHLNGSIPVSLATLANLKVLCLSNNMLEGTIPESLGQLQNLRFLDISNNHLNGGIPKTIGQLSNLLHLILYNNSLDGKVFDDHFSNLSKLEFLNIGLNNLTFNIGSNWFPPFQLKHIFLRSCKFETGFPEWMKTQKKARTLVLSNAHIIGPIPTWFEDMQFIMLDLSYNHITGQLSNFPPHLKYLDLSLNSISGYLPRNISKIMPFVSVLYLTNNLISGPLPASFCDMKNLLELDLSENNLIGDIPDCWSNESSLCFINFSSNKLSGIIPKSMGQLSQLLSLHLNNNSLHGQLPKDLQNCADLVILDLGENKFFGNLPSWIGTNFTWLEILRLRENKFYGSIPWQFCSLSKLQILDLGINNLTGSIPPCLNHTSGMYGNGENSSRPFETDWDIERVVEIIKGRYLQYTKNIQFLGNLDLSKNHLVGSIPRELFSLSWLVGLNLSHNGLTGNISSNIKDMISLESFDLSSNQLSGPIPQEMSSLYALNHLNLSNNNLSGQVPQGNQLQTIYDEDPFIYVGNPLLCGYPLPQKCDEAEVAQSGRAKPLNGRRQLIADETILVIIIVLGYVMGFWGVIIVLIIKKSWRIAYFNFVDETINKLYVVIAVKLAKIHER